MACASRSKRSLKRMWPVLMATNRFRRVSRAFQTSPIPPSPRGERISYGPILSSTERGMTDAIMQPAVRQNKSGNYVPAEPVRQRLARSRKYSRENWPLLISDLFSLPSSVRVSVSHSPLMGIETGTPGVAGRKRPLCRLGSYRIRLDLQCGEQRTRRLLIACQRFLLLFLLLIDSQSPISGG